MEDLDQLLHHLVRVTTRPFEEGSHLSLPSLIDIFRRHPVKSLGAAGEAGVDHVLSNFAAEMKRTMALIGCTRLEELGPEYLTSTN